jgi:hypothetical protein
MTKTTKRRRVRTVAGVIEAMGGVEAMAEWAGVRPDAVEDWIAKSWIDAGWHYRLDRLLAARGFDVDPAVFGVTAAWLRAHALPRVPS